jgi:hypothetical protein
LSVRIASTLGENVVAGDYGLKIILKTKNRGY